MSRRRGLGRGLDALLGGTELLDTDEQEEVGISTIAVDRVRRGKYQPRRNFPEASLRELADSIHVPYQRINQLVNGRRGITPSTALRLARLQPETVLREG